MRVCAHQVVKVSITGVPGVVLPESPHEDHTDQSHKEDDHHERVEDREPVDLREGGGGGGSETYAVNELRGFNSGILQRAPIIMCGSYSVLEELWVKVFVKSIGKFSFRRFPVHLQVNTFNGAFKRLCGGTVPGR